MCQLYSPQQFQHLTSIIVFDIVYKDTKVKQVAAEGPGREGPGGEGFNISVVRVRQNRGTGTLNIKNSITRIT